MLFKKKLKKRTEKFLGEHFNNIYHTEKWIEQILQKYWQRNNNLDTKQKHFFI